jgi:hypothetical protein
MDAAHILLLDERRNKAIETYAEKVKRIFGDDLLLYYVMGEGSGLVADNFEGTAARDGEYVGVTLGQPGIGDGNTCPLFDGANDYLNGLTDSIATALGMNITKLSVMVWLKVYEAAVWDDETYRYPYNVEDDWDDSCQSLKWTTTGKFTTRWGGGESDIEATMDTVDFFHLLQTVDTSLDEHKMYIDAVQTGGTGSGMTDLYGPIEILTVGAKTTTPNSPWYGWLAHFLIATMIPNSAQRTALATV